jgi:hypothetical protein
MNEVDLIFCGFEHALTADWQDFVAPPAQGNRKPETYAEQLPAMWQDKHDKILAGPPTLSASKITKVAWRSPTWTGDGVCTGTALEFVTHMNARETPGVFVGVDLKLKFRQLGWDMLMKGKGDKVRPWMWGNSWDAIIVDLYSLSGARSQKVPIQAWLNRWGLSAGNSADLAAKALPACNTMGTAENEQRWVREVCQLMGLTVQSMSKLRDGGYAEELEWPT